MTFGIQKKKGEWGKNPNKKPKTKPPIEPLNSILITLAPPSFFDEQNNVFQL
jgi:hypothetical protein